MKPLQSTLAVGFDIVHAIDPASYRITEDARGRAWAFQMDDETRQHVAKAVREALDRPRDVVELNVEPGYVHVKIEPAKPHTATATPRKPLESLGDVPQIYNERYAESDAETLAFVRDAYVGSYVPEDVPTLADYVTRHVDVETAPESEGPVFEYVREDAGEKALDASQAFAYKYVLPFDAKEMYEAEERTGGPRHNVDLEPPEVREHLQDRIEDLIPWPGNPRVEIPRIAVYPTHVEVEHWTADHANPASIAQKGHQALLQYNRGRPEDEARSPRGGTYRHPPIALKDHAYIHALDHGRTAEEWIREQGLDEVDGEPVEPVEPEAEPEDVKGDKWDALNPFN